MPNDFDTIPVKLPSGTTAIVKLPRIFTMQDGVHLMNFLSLYLTDKTGDPLPLPNASAAGQEGQTLTRCAAGRDGECGHAQCPQLRDNEPAASGRHCPLDNHNEDDE